MYLYKKHLKKYLKIEINLKKYDCQKQFTIINRINMISRQMNAINVSGDSHPPWKLWKTNQMF